jgi:hypothetical protein
MKPTIFNLIFAFTILSILRYIVLQYFPTIIINGYFSIFLCFFIISAIFTKNIFYSTIIGLLVINGRIIYRAIKDKKTLNEYNSFSNCLIFTFALLLLSLFLVYFEKIHKLYNQYYSYLIVTLILLNLYSLKINETDSQLLCFV